MVLMVGDRLNIVPDSKLVDHTSLFDPLTKAAIITASPCVVAVVTHHLPGDVPEGNGPRRRQNGKDEIWRSGVIIESIHNTSCLEEHVLSKEASDDGRYVSTIIAPATLFKRTNNRQHCDEIEVDVYLSDGKLYKGELLGCDFNYNLAAIIIHSDCSLQAATLRGLDDVISIDNKTHLEIPKKNMWELRSHSNLFKVEHGTKIMALSRYNEAPYGIGVMFGTLSSRPNRFGTAFKELFALTESNYIGNRGGVVVNFNAEVIGIMFDRSAFLPTNLLLRWWDHFKKFRECRQPWLGVEVYNLHESNINFLGKFLRLFPNVVAGVVVTKVDEGSPAYYAGIQPDDVIVKCDGKLIRSKLQLFENMWDKAGKNVEVNALRVSNGDHLNERLTIGETAPDKFYQWPLDSFPY